MVMHAGGGDGEAGAAALVARGVSARLGGREVLRGVDARAEYGAITAVLGPNGAGKTTLLECLAGILPCAGAIEVAGAALAELSYRQRAARVAYVPQRSVLDAPLSVATVVGHGRYAHSGSSVVGDGGGAGDDTPVGRAIAATDIAHLRERSYLELSGGEQRRVLMARALATGARILLLDEPTASLDIGHALALFRMMRALADDGVCVVVVLHDLDDALRYTDRAVLLADGRVATSGPTAEVLGEAPIREVYGVELHREERLAFRLPPEAGT